MVVDKRSESTVFTGTVQRLRPDGHVVVRITTPESEVNRLVVGAPSDFMEVAE
jgi:hypothetical protein